jgi:AhpD family alkylhydroperoxidase
MKLEDHIKELIAVGASIAANCQPCLEYHAGEARKSGADAQEVTDAIEVGKMVRRGAASKMDKFAASLSQPPAATTASSGDACGWPS